MIDRGGTFTDIVAESPRAELITHKLLSENPGQYEDAAIEGIRQVLGLREDQDIPIDDIDFVRMGTTVATNALLERKGDPTVYVTTRGFEDVLQIGYQNRPDLFALNIRKPSVLYDRVIGADERVSADGAVLIPLDTGQLQADLEVAYEQGYRSIAIALMHGYRFSEHEIEVARLATEVGFDQISVSHVVSPLMKLIARGETTVVDAYLSPKLGRYTESISQNLGMHGRNSNKLLFMQSNGGLSNADHFSGKDAILSGPAGGVVGMAETAKAAGLTKAVGFDMGGTSTDVCHFKGEYERVFESEVAGARICVPMMDIHTVAAGGGSIVRFDGARFRVGPESAGANPGPACYRKGGPLTITDCNVLLGRLIPEMFPQVFGESGTEPIDTGVVQTKFKRMVANVNERFPTLGMTSEQAAEGFIRIAVENMANAIRKVSVQRGHNVSEYALNCFGGAGGQHACKVAEALGISTVYIHPFAGVLSAYGMGLAEIRAIEDYQIEAVLNEESHSCIEGRIAELSEVAVGKVESQGIDEKDIYTIPHVHIRYVGSHTALIVPFTDADTMIRNFNELHRDRYGFSAEDRDVVVEAVSVEAVGESGQVSETLFGTGRDEVNGTTTRMFVNGAWQDVEYYTRDEIGAGVRVRGPAMILESTGTNVIDDGWSARVSEKGEIIMEKNDEAVPEVVPGAEMRASGQGETDTDVDPVMLEVFNNIFKSVADQMGTTLSNTAFSVNIKERLDFSCALFDPHGNLVANAPHVPVHLGSMSQSVRQLIQDRVNDINPGDVFMQNAPFEGGTHLPDITVISPVFDREGQEILFFVGSRAHHADVGGSTPGSAPPFSQSIHEEGVMIRNFRLVEGGKFNLEDTRSLLGSGRYPCRNIDQNIADLSAQGAANQTGINEIVKVIEMYGLDMVQSYMGYVQDNAEESVRSVVAKLKHGSFTYPLDNELEVRVEIRPDIVNREVTIDFTGTSAQDSGNFNAPVSIVKACVLYVFRTLIGDEIPLNEGCMKPINLIVPEGTFINPEYPAAVISGNTEVSQNVTDALFGALGVMAASQGTMNNLVYGNDTHQNYETICGGAGAGDGFDGASAVHTHMTNTKLTDPEVLEMRYPVRIRRFAVRTGSGGVGAWSGGDGVVRELEFLEPMTVTVLTSHRIVPPFGSHGGNPGQCGENILIRKNGESRYLAFKDQCEVQSHDVVRILTPGGGGYGLPTSGGVLGKLTRTVRKLARMEVPYRLMRIGPLP